MSREEITVEVEHIRKLEIGSKGRVTVPIDVRKDLGLGEGDKIRVAFDESSS